MYSACRCSSRISLLTDWVSLTCTWTWPYQEYSNHTVRHCSPIPSAGWHDSHHWSCETQNEVKNTVQIYQYYVMFGVYESDGKILDLKTSTSALLAQKCLDNRTCHGRIFVLFCLAQYGEMNCLVLWAHYKIGKILMKCHLL